MNHPHRVKIYQLKPYVSSIDIQRIIERQFDTSNTLAKKTWGFNVSGGPDMYPIEALFAEKSEATEFANTVNELYGIVLDEPLTVKSAADEAPVDPLLTGDSTYRYQLLGRLKQDCVVYFDAGEHNISFHNPKRLWAQNEDDQVQAMETLWNSFGENEKPEWTSLAEIHQFKDKFAEVLAESSTPAARPRP